MERAIVRAGRRDPEAQALRQQLVDAAILLLAASFQYSCRELHTEAARFLAARVADERLSRVVEEALLTGRALARGNAHPRTLTDDFRRLDIDLWDELDQRDSRNKLRRSHLVDMNRWRNAIAHGDFDPAVQDPLGQAGRSLASLRTWRHSCSALLHELDAVVKQRLTELAGSRPW